MRRLQSLAVASWIAGAVGAIGCNSDNAFSLASAEAGADQDAAPPSSPDSGSMPVTIGSMTVSATLLDFGAADCGGNAPPAQTLSLQNNGASSVTFSSLVDNTQSFSISGPASGALDPGQSVTLTIVPAGVLHNAIAGVPLEANLKITTTDPAAPTIAVLLRITPQGAALRLVPSTVDFGEVALNQSEDIPVSLSNVGNQTVSIHLDGAAGDFSLTANGTGDVSVSPNRVVDGLVAHFHPTTTSAQSQTVAVHTTGAICGGSIDAVIVKGTGTTGQATVGPGTLDFSLVDCGSSAGAQSVHLKNWGNAPYDWAAKLGKGASSPYSLTPSSGTLVPGASVDILVTPAPITAPASTAANAFGDTLNITTDAPADSGSHSVALLETAQGAILTVNPTSIAFGEVATNQVATDPFTVTNVGNLFANVTLSAAPGVFRIEPATMTVPANAGVGAFASFQPTTAGQFTGSVTLASQQPQCGVLPTVALSGSSQAPPPPPQDAGGPPQDAGSPPPDAGHPPDAGPPPQDAGSSPDASSPPDAASPVDSGAPADATTAG